MPQVRRRQIVRAAVAALIELGYQRTSIGDVVRRARLGHDTVYRYFVDERDLLDHVLDYAAHQSLFRLRRSRRIRGACRLG